MRRAPHTAPPRDVSTGPHDVGYGNRPAPVDDAADAPFWPWLLATLVILLLAFNGARCFFLHLI